MAKSTPPMGAPKAAATPAAVPQATKSRFSLWFCRWWWWLRCVWVDQTRVLTQIRFINPKAHPYLEVLEPPERTHVHAPQHRPAALREAGADDGAAVDDGALEPEGQAAGLREDDAGDLGPERAEAHDAGVLDPVQVRPDLRDARPRRGRLHQGHPAGERGEAKAEREEDQEGGQAEVPAAGGQQPEDGGEFEVRQRGAAGDDEDADKLGEHAHERRQRPAEEGALPAGVRPEELPSPALVLVDAPDLALVRLERVALRDVWVPPRVAREAGQALRGLLLLELLQLLLLALPVQGRHCHRHLPAPLLLRDVSRVSLQPFAAMLPRPPPTPATLLLPKGLEQTHAVAAAGAAARGGLRLRGRRGGRGASPAMPQRGRARATGVAAVPRPRLGRCFRCAARVHGLGLAQRDDDGIQTQNGPAGARLGRSAVRRPIHAPACLFGLIRT